MLWVWLAPLAHENPREEHNRDLLAPEAAPPWGAWAGLTLNFIKPSSVLMSHTHLQHPPGAARHGTSPQQGQITDCCELQAH